ncbi:MAG: hypothetical protein WBL27_11575 [Salinimicrobium sp.]
MRNFLWALIALLLLGCAKDRSGAGEMTDYIPENSAVVLKLQNPDLFFSNLKNNEFIKQNKDFPAFEKLSKQLELLQNIPHKQPAFLVFSSSKDSLQFSFITSQKLNAADSLVEKSSEIILNATEGIQKSDFDGTSYFTAARDSIFILSNSEAFLKSSLKNDKKLTASADFQRVLKAASSKEPSVFINHENFTPLLKKWFQKWHFKDFSNWTVLDADISQTSIRFNGVTTASDSIPAQINLFKDVPPAENQLANITPLNSNGLLSVTFQDFAPLKQNLLKFQQGENPAAMSSEELLQQSSAEAGMIYLPEHEVFAVRSLDPDAVSFSEELAENFREIDIFEYSGGESFSNLLQPLLKPKNLKFYAQFDQYFVFSETSEALQQVITAFQNEQVTGQSTAFAAASENLSSAASLLLISNNKGFKNVIPEAFSEELNFEDFPMTALQFVYQSDFAHVHAVLTKSTETAVSTGAAQETSVSLAAPVAGKAIFFKNHRSNGMDVAVQDEKNTLYLISPQGRIYWKKQLQSRILGEIQSVDILKNGRYQLAFATQNELHVIDRDGNTVKPFPLKFRDEITQPLAVFDYENKRDYRFVVVQNRQVYMYDNKGRRVKGFGFDKADDRILHPPKHIRIGRKDYIIIAEEGGKIDILSRQGKIRVKVKEDVAFSDNEWYEYQGDFVSTNKNGQLVTISEAGKIKRKDLGLADNHKITSTVKTFVSLSENQLKIKGNTATLDFGLYTEPQIFYLNNKIYVSVTDLQTHKVFLFDSNAQLLSGFPVYGNSTIDMANADGDSAPELVVQGDEDSVLIYEVK